jgi:hypothetical protein
MDKELKEENRKNQKAADDRNVSSDEEFAEKIYDDDAPTPPRFDEQHGVTYSGSELKEE